MTEIETHRASAGRKPALAIVIPAQAGIQKSARPNIGSRLRENDAMRPKTIHNPALHSLQWTVTAMLLSAQSGLAQAPCETNLFTGGGIKNYGAAALEDDVLVVGSAYEKIVHIYRYEKGQWTIVQTITDDHPDPDTGFGTRLQMDNDFIAVPAPAEDINPSGYGAVYMYQYMGSQWKFQEDSAAGRGLCLRFVGFFAR